MKRHRLQPLLACALLLAPLPASAIEVGVELSPAVAVPLGSFIDRYPVFIPRSQAAGDGSVIDYSEIHRVTLDSDVGWAANLTVLLDDFELRYSFSRHTWGEMLVDAVAFDVPDAPFLASFFFDFETFGGKPQVFGDADEALEPLNIHRILVGYRFYVLDGDIRPYVPFDIGFVVMHGPDFDTMLGGTVEIGLGVQYAFLPRWAAGVEARYAANIMQNPALEVTGLSGQAAQSSLGDDSLFESVVEVMQTLTFSASISYRF